ncbi:hypothetical protein Tco_1108907 [Tanacetum coccineum]
MSPSGSKSASSIPGGVESFVRKASISSKMKLPPSKGVREGKEVERIGSKDGVGLPTINDSVIIVGVSRSLTNLKVMASLSRRRS